MSELLEGALVRQTARGLFACKEKAARMMLTFVHLCLQPVKDPICFDSKPAEHLQHAQAQTNQVIIEFDLGL